ncbi:MAG: rRNA pseudouridine synthase [Clostridia bacterium]|nr:rRNA pseudouridine synthase [Clostridia bacterium]
MDSIKLQKYFSDCGIMSRRAAETVIANREVTVNGQIASLGDRIVPNRDTVVYKGQEIHPKAGAHTYLLLHKPRGYVTTVSDEKGRPTALSLLKGVSERVYPVGRLDMDSEGLLLLTDDGELTYALTHPRHSIPKRYHVTISGALTPSVLQRLSSSMVLDGYRILPVEVTVLSSSDQTKEAVLEMILYEGRNRQIRKMCGAVGLSVKRLCRVAIGNIELGDLPRGDFRPLTEEEIQQLKQAEQAVPPKK